MKKPIPISKERVVYKGKIFEVVKQPMQISEKKVEFELARRSPGVRLIITKDNKILLTKEFRFELNELDYRLPGGKVFDTLEEYKKALNQGKDILIYAIEAARRECLEETGFIVKRIKHIHTTTPGATVIWDLFYFVIDKFEKQKSGQILEDGEVIYPEWRTFKEVKQMCLNKKIKEDRTVGVLLRFLSNVSNS